MFDEDRNKELYKVVKLQEVHFIFKSFSKDKCPRLDRWTIELFLHFFDLLGQDLIQMVEQSRLEGYITNEINSTYISLIPK